MSKQPWQGDLPCLDARCADLEIEGLGYCLRHVPADSLAEAEAITGWHRCQWGRGHCREIATAQATREGAWYCPMHVQEDITRRTRRTGGGQVNEDMETDLAAIMTEHGEALLHPPRIGDPLEALLLVADQMMALCDILRNKVATLAMSEWRYSHLRVGEQIRTEVYLYERALDRIGKHLVNIAKLRIAEHKLELDQELAGVVERALGIALEASGADLVGQDKARSVLARELAAYTK